MSAPERMLELWDRTHQMTVKRDDGVYRHIRFQEPGTSIWYFDIVTWPGHLVITGDVEDFHFARIPDMFEFFRSPVGYINPRYWSEKLRGPTQYESYSAEKARRAVFDHFWELRHNHTERAPLWRRICQDVLTSDIIEFEDEARRAIEDFRFNDFEFVDSYDWDLKDFDYQFLVSLHAIVWGINQYDRTHESGDINR